MEQAPVLRHADRQRRGLVGGVLVTEPPVSFGQIAGGGGDLEHPVGPAHALHAPLKHVAGFGVAVPEQEREPPPEPGQLAGEGVAARPARLGLVQCAMGGFGVVMQAQAYLGLHQLQLNSVDLRSGRRHQLAAVPQRPPRVLTAAQVEHELDRVERVQPQRLRIAAVRLVEGHRLLNPPGGAQPGDDPGDAENTAPRTVTARIVESGQPPAEERQPHQQPVERSRPGRGECGEGRWRLVSAERDHGEGDVPGSPRRQQVGHLLGVGRPARVPEAPRQQHQCLTGAVRVVGCQVGDPAMTVPGEQLDAPPGLFEGEGDPEHDRADPRAQRARGRPQLIKPPRRRSEVHSLNQLRKHLRRLRPRLVHGADIEQGVHGLFALAATDQQPGMPRRSRFNSPGSSSANSFCRWSRS